MMKTVYLSLVALLLSPAAFADSDDSAKLITLLNGKSIACKNFDKMPALAELPIRFYGSHGIIAVDAPKDADGYDALDVDQAFNVEVTPTWINLTLSEDANIYKEFHIRYNVDPIDHTLSLDGAIMNTDGDNGVTDPLSIDCDLSP